MAIIGSFTRSEGGFEGTVETLTCPPVPVLIIAVQRRNPQAPNYRVYRGGSEIGAAWAKKAKSGRSYLIVSLDDPALAKPIQARLVTTEDRYDLLWSRD